MPRGRDEAHNPKRRPQRPQTDEEKMAIVKEVFPNAQEVDPNAKVSDNPYDDDNDYSPTLEDELNYLDETGIDPMTGERWN